MKNIFIKWQKIKAKNSRLIMLVCLLLIVPSICSVFLGIEMQANQIKQIPTIVYDQDQSAFSRMLVDEIKTNDIFHVNYYANSSEEVEKSIKNNRSMVGVIIPPDFSDDIIKANAPKVLVFYDGSSMAVASAAKARMNEILLTLKAGYMKKVLEGKLNIVSVEALKQVQPIAPTYRILYNPTRNYRNFILPGMLISIAQIILAIIGADYASKKHNTKIGHLIETIKWGTIGSISIIVPLGIQIIFYALPINSSVIAMIAMTWLFSVGIVSFGYLVGRVVKNRMFATQMACFIVMPSSILGGYTFPIFSMPKIFDIIGVLIPYNHYANGIRSLMLKSIDLSIIGREVLALCIFIVIMWISIFATTLINRSEKMSNKVLEVDYELN